MQIILQEDVEKLGTRGEVVEVAAGYARNYLLPHKFALEASPANIKRLEKIRITLSKRTATEKGAAEQQAALLNNVTVKFARVGESMVTVKLVHGVTAQFKVVVEKEG